MKTKCTLIVHTATNVSDPTATARRTGSFSESYYADGPFSEFIANSFRRVCQARALLLPTGFAVVGQRFQQVDPVGGSSVSAVNFPGGASLLADVPQMALHFRVRGVGVPNVRSVDLRGTPDARVVEGEYRPEVSYTSALNSFFKALSGNFGGPLGGVPGVPFLFRGRSLTETAFPIVDILGNGTYSTDGNNTIAINDRVQVLRTTSDTTNEQLGGFFYVSSIISSTSGILHNWTAGLCRGGRIRKAVVIYPPFPNADAPYPTAIEKKVGRDLSSYRGRRSSRI